MTNAVLVDLISLQQVIVNAPSALREELQPLSKMALFNRCAGLRPGRVTTPRGFFEVHPARSPGVGSS